ncbi:MAG: hypothetical protein ACREF7_01800, partial [Candidatus Saccharimonadales bacterium]
MRQKLLLVIACIFSTVLLVGQASAITSANWNSILNNSFYYDGQQQTCTPLGLNTNLTVDASKAVWTSNAQAPYYLEEYIVNILEDIAQTLNVPQSDTVTQDHVDAMLAWAWVEGGNSGNNGNYDAFNVWNTGIDDPSLLAPSSKSGALESFKSFDAGVEANTLSMVGSYQSRIGAALSDPNSSAEQVLQAIANFNDYQGNLGWSTSSTPSQYLSGLMTMLQQVNQDYDQLASAEIGPNASFSDHVAYSLLQYSGGTSSTQLAASTTTSNNSGCIGANIATSCTSSSGTVTGDAAILCAAETYNGIYYSWGGGHQGYTEFRASCPLSSVSAAASSSTATDPGPCATDCSGLVSIAVNQAFNSTAYSWVVNGEGVMEGSGAQYWQSIPIAQAQAGDI